MAAPNYIERVLIRHADPAADAAACAAIYEPYVRDTVISLEERAPTAEHMRMRIERISRSYPWLIAEEAGEVAGYAYGGEHRERAAYRWSSDVTVYLAPAYYRRGIGRALYMTLFDLLARQGFYVACAGITLPNQASVGLHESLGFVPVGIYHRVAFKFGAWWDVGWWELQLIMPSTDQPAEPGPPPDLEQTPLNDLGP